MEGPQRAPARVGDELHVPPHVAVARPRVKEHVAVVAEHHHVGRLDRQLRADAGLRHRDDVVDVLDVRRPAGLAAEVARLQDVGHHGDVEPRAAHLAPLVSSPTRRSRMPEHHAGAGDLHETGADARRGVQAEHVGKLTHRLRGVLLHADERVHHRPAIAGDQHAEAVDLRRGLLVEPDRLAVRLQEDEVRRAQVAVGRHLGDAHAPQRRDRRRQALRRLGLDHRGRRRQSASGRRPWRDRPPRGCLCHGAPVRDPAVYPSPRSSTALPPVAFSQRRTMTST